MRFKKQKRPPLRPLYSRTVYLLLSVIIIFILIHNLPSPPATENDTRADRPPPKHTVEYTPRYLHHSPFRVDPNLEYESKLSAALRNIEHNVLVKNGGDDRAKDRIWQIMLEGFENAARTSDSMLFEQVNAEWEYTVSWSLSSRISTGWGKESHADMKCSW